MDDPNEIEKLLRLKKYETPGEDYFTGFAESFKERQRTELLQQSSVQLLAERVSLWFQELGNAKWLLPAGAGVAAIVFVTLSTMNDSEGNSDMIAKENQEAPQDGPMTFELNLPRPGNRVPAKPDQHFSDPPEKLNASFGGGRREL